MEKPNNFKNILMGTILFWAAITLLLFVLSMFSCKHPTPNPCNSDDLHYRTDIKPIIKRNCSTAGCHNNSNTLGNFDIYSELNEKCNDGSFEKRVLIKKNMPPFKMDTCDFIKLRTWYLDGHGSK
jgi:hypothetical protein